MMMMMMMMMMTTAMTPPSHHPQPHRTSPQKKDPPSELISRYPDRVREISSRDLVSGACCFPPPGFQARAGDVLYGCMYGCMHGHVGKYLRDNGLCHDCGACDVWTELLGQEEEKNIPCCNAWKRESHDSVQIPPPPDKRNRF